MEIDVLKKMIERRVQNFSDSIKMMTEGEAYYKNESDIISGKGAASTFEDVDIKPNKKNPMRNANNRIPFPFYPLLTNQKAAYVMTKPPKFSIDDKVGLDKEINDTLGNKFPKICKDLVINAANMSISWLHVWVGEKDNKFKYGIVDSRQIIPIYSAKLDKELLGVLRVYDDFDDNGVDINVAEYWTDKQCETYFKKSGKEWTSAEPYNVFNLIDVATKQETGKTNVITHDWGRVPFIPFHNNSVGTNDLVLIKKIQDLYEKVSSGFANDLDDLQEVIFILTNYGGVNKAEFLQDMKKYKLLKLDVDEGEQAGVDTLQIEIPIEAREKLLERAEDAIFKLGMGVNPTKEDFSNTSGAALKFIYSLLELKSGITETEFRLGFDNLMWFVLSYLGEDVNLNVEQTWERTSIRNDSEEADVVAKLADVSSQETIAYANPLVTNPERELELLKEKGQDNYGGEAEVLAETISSNQTGAAGQGDDLRGGVQSKTETNPKGN